MFRLIPLSIFMSCFTFLSLGGIPTQAADDTAFGYACENCPANWGNLSDDFAACVEGTAQSPIAVDRAGARSRGLPGLRVRYEESALEVERLRTNFEAFVEDGSGKLIVGDEVFALVQFHFHSTSEHVVGGERYPLEMHFVNRTEAGDLAVLGVFIKEGDNFDELDPLIDILPVVEGLSVGEFAEVDPIDVGEIPPRRRTSLRYTGSTTTPPCTGGVQWVLLATPIELSAKQIAAIQETIRNINDGFDNNRPIQVRNGRTIVTDISRDDDDDDDNDRDD